MKGESLPSCYDPSSVEEKWYRFWESRRLFHSEVDRSRKPYTIMIPPPNVTSFLHMGHALNNTLQDILVRWRRLQGYNVLWMPGTDHAGIATQNVVERQLAREGLTRHDLGREQFVEKVWEWKNEYGNRIIGQLKRLGCSCDWERERFTMDEGLSAAVFEAFVRLYRKGLIYRGKRIINWCPRCRTALADDEVEHREVDGKMYWIRYPLEGEDGYVVVATTRPETMLGDTAVAVNPSDPRHASLIGKKVRLPFVDRVIPVIGDEYVDMEFGSGALKVTPAHDPADFELGQRHGLPAVVVIDEDGRMNENAGMFQGMDRMECRERIVRELQQMGLFEAQDGYTHSVGHCYRCRTVVEPYLSEQWFVRMKPLAEPAIKAVRSGRIRFHPRRWEKVYFDWMENIRDWCISRQIWWGHRIPVWKCEDCGGFTVSREKVVCEHCGGEKTVQDEDVLDTWFSSWLWPFSTLGWPEETEDLEYYYPTDVLVTGSDIIFFWVARMIMAGIELVGEIPFRDVYLNAMIKDDQGRIMSKSLGNVIDPIEMIEKYGADAVRFSLVILTSEGQDVKLHETKFEMGRNFANKLWNSARLLALSLEGLEGAGEEERRGAEDEWIVRKLSTLVREVTDDLESFRFNEMARRIYDFTWHVYCDWYLEMMKLRLSGKVTTGTGVAALKTAVKVMEHVLRLLHPLMPFVTEEIWQLLKSRVPSEWNLFAPVDSIMLASWPTDAVGEGIGEEVEEEMETVIGVVRAVRNLRRLLGWGDRKVDVILSGGSERTRRAVEECGQMIACLGKIGSLEMSWDGEVPRPCVAEVVGDLGVYIPLADEDAVDAQVKRLQGKLESAVKRRDSLASLLKNEEFLARASSEVVEARRENLKEAEEQVALIERILEMLQR